MMKGTKAVAGMNIKRLVFGICVAFVLLCAFMGVSVASAKTICVPDDYEKIQWAVDNASVGDTIIVRDGTYTENINVNKPHLTIRSENGADSTIVHAANPDDHVFEVTADYVNISGFTVEGASGGCKAGIYLEYVQYCNISNNNLLNNSWGIYFYASSNNIIRNNKASNNNDDAIYLDFSSNNSVSNNDLSNNGNGISVYSSFSNLISNNIINSNNYNGISVTSSSYNKIINNTISYCNTGIVLGNSSDNTIINNICNFNSYSGIYFWKFVEEGASSNNSVINNTCVSNEIGIFLDASPNNKLLTNNCSLNNIGVELSCLCNNTAIWNNFIYSNSVGIFVGMSTNISICNNTVIQNNCGISIAGSSYGEIKNNSICSNKYGMCITPSSINDIEWTSSDNTIYLNNFINNIINVYSYNSTNIWNSTSKIIYTYNGKTYTNYLGNYWSDYTGSDANGDGIGDTLYSIDGDKDYYPLMERFENYFGGVENKPPIADFTYLPLLPVVDQTITFDASNSTDPDGTIISYEWDFGDGTTGSGKVITHSYEESKIYRVTLTVIDNKGAKSQFSIEIPVVIIHKLPGGIEVNLLGEYTCNEVKDFYDYENYILIAEPLKSAEMFACLHKGDAIGALRALKDIIEMEETLKEKHDLAVSRLKEMNMPVLSIPGVWNISVGLTISQFIQIKQSLVLHHILVNSQDKHLCLLMVKCKQ